MWKLDKTYSTNESTTGNDNDQRPFRRRSLQLFHLSDSPKRSSYMQQFAEAQEHDIAILIKG